MTLLVGTPDIASTTQPPLSATLIYTRPYQRGDRLGMGSVALTYDWALGEWQRDSEAFDLVAARFGQSDPAPPEIRISFTIGTGQTAQGTILTLSPIENAPGVLDITKPLHVAQWVTGTAYQSLQAQMQDAIADLNAFTAAGGAVAGDMAAAVAGLSGVLADLEQSADYANGLTGVASQDIYTAEEVLPARPEGTQAIRYTLDGLWGRVKRIGAAWVDYGSPMLSLLGLKLRLGYNVLDYKHLVVGDDWAPAWNAMYAEAPSGSTVTAPFGDYIIRSPVKSEKVFHFRHAGATLIPTGDGFLPDTSVVNPADAIPGITGQPRPAFDLVTTAGNGSFGDNSALGQNRLSGYLPNIERTNALADRRDGSVGLRINNGYYPDLNIGKITGFNAGMVVDGCKTGSGVRGSSHGRYKSGRLENLWNLIIMGRMSTDGWVTENNFSKTSFGSPEGFDANTTPADHTHLLMYCGATGTVDNNTFNNLSFEGYAKFGVDIVGPGPVSKNSWYQCRFEMPYATKRVRVGAGAYANHFAYGYGLDLSKIEDNGSQTSIVYSDFRGEFNYFNKVTLFRNANGNPQEIVGNEWYPLGPENPQAITYSGTPIVLDASKGRRWLINATVNMPANSVSIINWPTLVTQMEVSIRQSAGAVTVTAGWLTGVKFFDKPKVPTARNLGVDTWQLTTGHKNFTGNALVMWHASDDNAAVSSNALLTTANTWTQKQTFSSGISAVGNAEYTLGSATGGVNFGPKFYASNGSTVLGYLGVNVFNDALQYAYIGAGTDTNKWLKVYATGNVEVAGRLMVSDVLRITVRGRASLPAAGTAGSGAIATISDPAAGKSNIVYSTGSAWVYMDGTTV